MFVVDSENNSSSQHQIAFTVFISFKHVLNPPRKLMGEFQSYLGRSYKSRQLEIGYDLITPVDSPFSITSCTLSDRAERGNVEEGFLTNLS